MNTALHYSAMSAQASAIKLLLKYKADQKLKNEFGQTALDVAKLSKNESVIDLLTQ